MLCWGWGGVPRGAQWGTADARGTIYLEPMLPEPCDTFPQPTYDFCCSSSAKFSVGSHDDVYLKHERSLLVFQKLGALSALTLAHPRSMGQ